MILVADQDDGIAATGKLSGFQMDLSNQRTGGVDDLQIAAAGLIPYLRGDAMCAEDGAGSGRDLVQLLHENRARFAQAVHNMLIVNDLLAHVNRRAVEIQRNLDHIDGPNDARAKSAWFQQKDLFLRA